MIKVTNVDDTQFPIEMFIGAEQRCLTIKAATEILSKLSMCVWKYTENPPKSKEPKIQPLRSNNKQSKSLLCSNCYKRKIGCERIPQSKKCLYVESDIWKK